MKAVGLIAWLVFALGLMITVLWVGSGGWPEGTPGTPALTGVLLMAVSLLYRYLIGRGVHWMWYVQLVLSVAALGAHMVQLAAVLVSLNGGSADVYEVSRAGGAAFGLLVHGAILYGWVQLDTKRWFVR